MKNLRINSITTKKNNDMKNLEINPQNKTSNGNIVPSTLKSLMLSSISTTLVGKTGQNLKITLTPAKPKSKKSETAKINALLNTINASPWLRRNTTEILKQPKVLGIHANQIINALMIGIAIKNGSINIGTLAPMQSGKSGTIYFLANYVLEDIGFLRECEHVLFVTSMTALELYQQNKFNLEQQPFDFVANQRVPSRIIVFKIGQLFKNPNPTQVVQNSNIKLVVRDEDHFGNGEDSLFDTGFLQELRRRLPDLPLLSVSATPFDILDAAEKGWIVEIVEGERPSTYFGITEMLKTNMVQNLPKHFQVFEKCKTESCGIKLNDTVVEFIDHLCSFSTGVGIIRVNSSTTAFALRGKIKTEYSGDLDSLFIGSDSNCDYSISEGLEEMKKRVITQKKRVVLVIVQALSAGKDFGALKEQIRFGIETRQKQLANVVQGLPGRMCGYHSNRSFKLLASVELLKKYSEFELDSNVFYTQEWRRGIFNNNVFDVSTQSRLRQDVEAGIITEVDAIMEYSKDDLKLPEIKKLVISKIGKDQYDTLMTTFEPNVYNSPKPFRLNDKTGKTTVRLASKYKSKAGKNSKFHSIYKSLKKTSDFGSVLFKKDDYEYGILISNYPVNHPKNTLGVCGIKLIKSGEKNKERLQEIGIDNECMYLPSAN